MPENSVPRVEGKHVPPTDCWLNEAVKVRSSRIEGLGLFAIDGFRAGTVVARPGGRLISDDELERRIVDAQRDPERPHVDSIAFEEDTNVLIPPGQAIHFVNHSCDPNLWHVGPFTLVARRDIAAGEELTIDYSTQTANPRFHLDCCCGSSRCRDMVTGEDWRSGELRERYGQHWVPVVLRKIAGL